jgi:hypothetical protein
MRACISLCVKKIKIIQEVGKDGAEAKEGRGEERRGIDTVCLFDV